MNLNQNLERTSLKNMTLLIVDDEPINAIVLENFLSGLFSINTVHSGEEAIVYCSTTAPDLILLDYSMPGISGLQTCKELKHNPLTQNIPVIFVTSNTNVEVQNSCWDAGGVDFISKPVSAQTVRNRVKTHMMYKLQSDNLKRMTYLDGLTGIYNRHLLSEVLPKIIQQGIRNGLCTSLLMIDVDYFKMYNDTYGHLAGDNALRNVASTIKLNLQRPADIVVRYGGEEFLCLSPETDTRGAEHIASSVLQSILALDIPNEQSPIGKLSISIGGAVAIPETPMSEDELIAKADEKLYSAKRNGRNQYQF